MVALDDLVVSNRSGVPAGRYRVYFGIDVASSAFPDLERGNFDTLVLDVAE